MTSRAQEVTEYVVGFCFGDGEFSEPNARVVLVRKKRPAWQEGYLNGVGGLVEQDETPADAIRREFKEETGVDITNWERTVVLRDRRGWIVHFFRGSTDLNQIKTMTDEKMGIYWIRNLPHEKIVPNLHWLIPLQSENMKFPVIIEEREGEEEIARS